MKMQHFLKRKEKSEAKILEVTSSREKTSQQELLSSSSRVKAWLKRMVTSGDRPVPQKLEIVIVLDIDEDRCNVGREVKASHLDDKIVQ